MATRIMPNLMGGFVDDTYLLHSFILIYLFA